MPRSEFGLRLMWYVAVVATVGFLFQLANASIAARTETADQKQIRLLKVRVDELEWARTDQRTRNDAQDTFNDAVLKYMEKHP